MAYVDLNSIPAIVANTPENSEHKSIKQRIEPLKPRDQELKTLEKFLVSKPESIDLFCNLIDYIEIVDWTGSILSADKQGCINSKMP